MIRDLMVAFRDLIQFRLGPQDLPYAPQLVGVLALVVLVANLSLTRAIDGEAAASPVGAVLAQAFALGLLHLLLSMKQVANRFAQTALAWVGVQLIFLLLAIPFAVAIGKTPQKPEEFTTQQLLLIWPLLALGLWRLGVQVHILRHALGQRLGSAVAVALLIDIVASILLVAWGSGASK